MLLLFDYVCSWSHMLSNYYTTYTIQHYYTILYYTIQYNTILSYLIQYTYNNNYYNIVTKQWTSEFPSTNSKTLNPANPTTPPSTNNTSYLV